MNAPAKNTAFGALLSGLMLVAPTLWAQNLDAMPQLQYTQASSQIANLALGEVARGTARSGTKAGRPGSAASFAYTPSAALKAQTVQNYVDRLKATNPAASRAVASTLGPGKYDYGQIYRGIIDGTGLADNDAAAAMSSFMIMGWMTTNNVLDDKAITPAMAGGVRAQLASQMAGNAQLAAPGVAAKLGEEMKLQCVVVQGGWQAAVRERTLPAYRQSIAGMFKNQYGMDMARFRLTPQGFAPKAGATTTAAATPAKAATAPAAPSGTGAAAGAQWFFRSVGDAYGSITFEPVALLANGQYCEVGESPLESLNPAADKAKRPAAWGTWRKNGSGVVLTNYKNQSNDYKLGTGSWFPAYAAGAVPLKRAYKNSSGGSIGGATSLVISKITFLDGSHFSEGADGGVVTANAAGGSRRSASGTYRLQGHTLTLTYADGRTVRQSFAIGAAGTPAHADNSMIFIGGDAYIEDK
ncbi:hypothetical protein ACFST9_21400 [Hymenobacter monticola]|uniref:Uncharacterized protein n=1 Tax=Hymenobacter monticola TaxID=1705399 RepID=A0ABY4B647_9BACT|nr:hypothetical protein [Hymenobacter monticola]UOE34344.1 hypothetical protein MTP16_01510 [Hymenobacter monticola]